MKGHEDPKDVLLFSSFNPSVIWCGCSTPLSGRFILRKDPVRSVQKAEWGPRPVWTGAENLAPTGIRSQDRPSRSESLYQLINIVYPFPSKEKTAMWSQLSLQRTSNTIMKTVFCKAPSL